MKRINKIIQYIKINDHRQKIHLLKLLKKYEKTFLEDLYDYDYVTDSYDMVCYGIDYEINYKKILTLWENLNKKDKNKMYKIMKYYKSKKH